MWSVYWHTDSLAMSCRLPNRPEWSLSAALFFVMPFLEFCLLLRVYEVFVSAGFFVSLSFSLNKILLSVVTPSHEHTHTQCLLRSLVMSVGASLCLLFNFKHLFFNFFSLFFSQQSSRAKWGVLCVECVGGSSMQFVGPDWTLARIGLSHLVFL